jgi:hypothetical protein
MYSVAMPSALCYRPDRTVRVAVVVCYSSAHTSASMSTIKYATNLSVSQ